MKIKRNGTDLLSAELTAGAAHAATEQTTTGFAVASIASGELLTFEIRNTAAATHDAKFVSVNLTVVAAHRTAA